MVAAYALQRWAGTRRREGGDVMNVKEITKAREQLAKLPPRPWTNPWEENEDGEAEAIRDAEGNVVIGLGYYDGYHLEVDIEVCQIILAIINTLYPATLVALEKAQERIAGLEGSSQPDLLSYEEYRKLVEAAEEQE